MTPTPLPPARRSLGQNFLVAGNAIERILDALELVGGETVLEIGPGRGALTLPLLARGARVVAVERDRALARRLEQRAERLTVIEHDILDLDLRQLAEEHAVRDGWLIVGNLPYNISKPIAMRLIRQRSAVRRAVLMFQREVAQRLTAGACTKRYAPLTVLAGASYRIEPLFELGPAAFRPRPKIVSTVTRWRPREDAADDATLERLSSCLAVCFASRRRTLRNNLRRAIGEQPCDRLLETAAIDGGRRAEQLQPEELQRLAALWPSRPDARD